MTLSIARHGLEDLARHLAFPPSATLAHGSWPPLLLRGSLTVWRLGRQPKIKEQMVACSRRLKGGCTVHGFGIPAVAQAQEIASGCIRTYGNGKCMEASKVGARPSHSPAWVRLESVVLLAKCGDPAPGAEPSHHVASSDEVITPV
jgi:hypothetical protein